jgi:hypothetical protein
VEVLEAVVMVVVAVVTAVVAAAVAVGLAAMAGKARKAGSQKRNSDDWF